MGPAVKARFARIVELISRKTPFLLQVGIAVFAFFASSANLFNGLFPLGIAVATGSSDHYAIAASVGAILGYIAFHDITTAMQYGIAVVAALVIRPFFGGVKNRVLVMGSIPLVATLSLLFMRLLLPFIIEESQVKLLAVLSESMLILFTAFMLSIFSSEIVRPERFSQLSGEGKASLVFVFMTLAATLLSITPFDFNLGVCLVGLLTCILAYSYGERICGVFAVAVLTAFSATRPELIHSAIGISVGGLFAGLLSHGEKLGVATLFFGCSVFGMVMAPTTTSAAGYIIEILLATTLFIILPKAVLKTGYQSDSTTPDVRSIAGFISGRLQNFAAALNEINEVVCEVFVRSTTKNMGGQSIAIDYAVDNCCKGCSGYESCWNNYTNDTLDAMHSAFSAIAGRGSVGPLWLGEIFKHRCSKINDLCSILHKGHAIAAAERSRLMKSEMMRGTLSEQFSAMGSALHVLAGEIYREESVDRNKTAKVISLFKELGLAPIEGSVVIEKNEKMRISVSCCRVFLEPAQRTALTEEVGYLLNRKFFPCVIKDFESITLFELYEVAQFTIEFAASGKAADNSGVNGDILKTFSDDYGNAHAILSDGMGKGRAAAIDASVAAVLSSRLLSAGFKTEEVARLVNVALSLKANEESGATLDILSVNLYTGNGVIFKAGAAPTYHISGDEIHCINAVTLPIGIMPNVKGTEVKIKLKLFDILIMVSDGTIGDEPDWLPDLIDRLQYKNSREIASAIIETAKNRDSNNQYGDDMSVIVLKIIPATTIHRREDSKEEVTSATAV